MPIERRYSDLRVGDRASLSKTITDADVTLFAGITGDFNPIHIDEEFAKKSLFEKRIVHGILGAGLISAVIGTDLPGINCIYLGQELKFVAPAYLGDTLTAVVEITELRDDKKIVRLKTIVKNQRDENIIEGEAVIKKHEPQ